MSGETNLRQMLRTLTPTLDSRRFTFSTHANMTLSEAEALSPIAVFQEKEGLTVISEHGEGEPFAMISLGVHSSLAAVGLTAAISGALADQNISANVVAAYYHDHIFLPQADAAAAMTILQNLAENP